MDGEKVIVKEEIVDWDEKVGYDEMHLSEFFLNSRVMVQSHCPASRLRPIQIPIKCVQDPVEICIGLCL